MSQLLSHLTGFHKKCKKTDFFKDKNKTDFTAAKIDEKIATTQREQIFATSRC